MSTLDTIVVGGLVVGGIFITAVALGGRFEQAANDASNGLIAKGGIVYGGKKGIDAAASRLGGGGGGGPIDLTSGKTKAEPSLPVAPPPAIAQPDGQNDEKPAPQPQPEQTMATIPDDCVIVVNIDGSTNCIQLQGLNR